MNENVLSEDHLKQLKEGSGISEEIIRLRGYRTVTDAAELKQLGFTRRQANVPGLLLPVHCTDGNNDTCLAVYRPDAPRVIEDRRKRNPDGSFKTRVIKYEMCAGAGMRLDCPRACRPRLADPDVHLWVTEGQKKADAMASRGLCAIDLLGVWNFKGRTQFGGVVWLTDWDYIALKGREVRIVFDSDVMVKPQVRAALDRLTSHLQRKGASVVAVYLPQEGGSKVGVDDYLLTHTVEELEGLIEGPRPQIAAAAPAVELLDDEPLIMRRPITLLNGQAYVAIWPYVRKSITETTDKEGYIIKYEQPVVIDEQQLLIMRSDGLTFGEHGFEPLSNLGHRVALPEIPFSDRLWSTKSIRQYRAGERPVPGDVFTRITDVIDRFIDFDQSLTDQRTMAEMVACWILSTWFLDVFNVIGFLWSNGQKGSGKTQLLLLITELSYLGQAILAGGSYASLRDLADYGATLGYDDAENLADPEKSDPDKRALLLAGNRRGSFVTMKLKLPDGSMVTRYVNTFCPRLFSSIETPDDVLASRTLIIPLVRTSDRRKGNADVLEYKLWPHDRRQLIDDCWALALSHLPELVSYEEKVNQETQLTGRELEPWRALLTVASWLTDRGVKGLWKRLHRLAYDYQGERLEIEAEDLTRLVVRAIRDRIEYSRCDTVTLCDGFEEGADYFLHTKNVKDAARMIAEEEELFIDTEKISSMKIGSILKSLRLRRSRQAGTGQRGWRISLRRLEKLEKSYGLNTPVKASQSVTVSHPQEDELFTLPEE